MYRVLVPQHPMQRPHPGLEFEGYAYRLNQQLPAPSDEEMELAMARARERFAYLMTPQSRTGCE